MLNVGGIKTGNAQNALMQLEYNKEEDASPIVIMDTTQILPKNVHLAMDGAMLATEKETSTSAPPVSLDISKNTWVSPVLKIALKELILIYLVTNASNAITRVKPVMGRTQIIVSSARTATIRETDYASRIANQENSSSICNAGHATINVNLALA